MALSLSLAKIKLYLTLYTRDAIPGGISSACRALKKLIQGLATWDSLIKPGSDDCQSVMLLLLYHISDVVLSKKNEERRIFILKAFMSCSNDFYFGKALCMHCNKCSAFKCMLYFLFYFCYIKIKLQIIHVDCTSNNNGCYVDSLGRNIVRTRRRL